MRVKRPDPCRGNQVRGGVEIEPDKSTWGSERTELQGVSRADYVVT